MNQIYHLKQGIKREKMDGRSPIQQSLYLEIKHDYVIQTDMDVDEYLTHLLMDNSTSIQFLCTSSNVILIDTTNKINNKKQSLCEIFGITSINYNFLVAFCLIRDEAAILKNQVLERFKDLLGGVQIPNLILTDQDEGYLQLSIMFFQYTQYMQCACVRSTISRGSAMYRVK